MKNRYLNLVFTHHAITRLYNRGISQEKAYEVFAHPDGQLPGKIPGSIKFYKNYDQQCVELIAKKNNKGEWVVLSAWIKLKNKKPYQHPKPLLQKIIGHLVEKIFK